MTHKRTSLNKQQQRRLAALFTSFLRGKKTLDKLIILILSGAVMLAAAAWTHKDGQNSNKRSDPFHGQTGKTYRCELKKIYDGDTVTARCNGQKGQQEIRIRLAGIDAPEMGQTPFGEESKRELGKRLGKHFDLRYLGPDYYHRSLGTLLSYGGRDINLQMIEDGYAFAYEGSDTPAAYKQAEKSARAARRGFWRKNKNQQPTSPKTWRRHHL